MVFKAFDGGFLFVMGSASSTFLGADAEEEKRVMVVSPGRGCVERNSVSVSRPR
jgi:hypothetical protein